MNNNDNKKIRIPGILVVFFLVVFVGFSGVTYALVGKVSVPDLSFAKNGLANLMDNFDTVIIVESDIVAEEIVEETVSPTPAPDTIIASSPSTIVSGSPALRPSTTPIPSPSMDSASSPLPSVATPTPAPTPLATICSTSSLSYRVRYIDGVFYQNHLDREKINKIALYAESQWESAVGADLFKHEDDNPNANAIDFTNNTSIKYNDEEAGQFGVAITSDADKNGLTDKFQITVFREIFYLVNGGNTTYVGELNKNNNLEESITARAVMHQMGHILGLKHLSDGQTGIMAVKWIPTTYKPTLSQDDIKQVKELCK